MPQGRKEGGIESGCCVREEKSGLNPVDIEKRVIKGGKKGRRLDVSWWKTGELASLSLCGAGRQGSCHSLLSE